MLEPLSTAEWDGEKSSVVLPSVIPSPSNSSQWPNAAGSLRHAAAEPDPSGLEQGVGRIWGPTRPGLHAGVLK